MRGDQYYCQQGTHTLDMKANIFNSTHNYVFIIKLSIKLFKYFQIMTQQAMKLDQFSPQELYQIKQGFES